MTKPETRTFACMHRVTQYSPGRLRDQARRCQQIAEQQELGTPVRIALDELADDLMREADAVEAAALWEAIPPSAVIEVT